MTKREPGPASIGAKASRLVAARHLRTALTLYYNAGWGDGRGELSPLAFSRRYVTAAVRDGLSYVLLSYYEDRCGGRRPRPGPGSPSSAPYATGPLWRAIRAGFLAENAGSRT